jgi:hypothetical protein
MAAQDRNGSATAQNRMKIATAATSALSSRRRNAFPRSARGGPEVEGRGGGFGHPPPSVPHFLRSAPYRVWFLAKGRITPMFDLSTIAGPVNVDRPPPMMLPFVLNSHREVTAR